MKTKTLVSAYFFLLAIVFASCSKEEQEPIEDFQGSAIVLNVTPPENIRAGDSAWFSVTFLKPDPCPWSIRIQTSRTSSKLNLMIFLIRDSETICTPVMAQETVNFTMAFPAPGVYTIRYLGENGLESIDVEVGLNTIGI